MQNHREDKMTKHSRKRSSRKSNKNIKSHQTSDEDVDTIHMFSNLDISDKSSQSSSCDQRIVDQLLKERNSLKSDPSGSSLDSHSHSLSDSQSLGITQDRNMDQAG